MKKRNIPIILGTFLLTAGTFFALALAWSHKKVEYPNELINISELSDEFMENYFSSFAETNQAADVNSTIIVTSTEKPENTFGATKMIEAPNSQYFLYYNSPSEKENAMRNIQEEPGVIYIEEDSLSKASEYNSWGIEDMGLNQAISIIDFENANEVTVAIIDTGCDLDIFNESFSGRIEETYNLYDSYMHDGNGHGTHIAGTIAEGTPENVKILPVKVSNSNSFRTSSIITAINYINYYHKADVINMSFGSNDNSKSEFVAIQSATNNNIISVAAAGNESSSANNSFPAAWDNTISVSAVDSNHEIADFSNYGSTVTFAAPGVDIYSINGKMSGTSMATPHVVSAVALLKSVNKSLTIDQAIDVLKTAAIDLGTEGHDDYYGYGLIDMSNFPTLAEFAQKTSTIDFEVTDTSEIEPHYGNITNLMNMPVRITDAAGNSYDLTLADLDDLEISGYDAFAAGEQEIQLSWNGVRKTIIVNNGSSGGNTSFFSIIDLPGSQNQEVAIRSVYGTPKKIYIPETISGHTVVAIGDGDQRAFSTWSDTTEHVILPNTIQEIRPKAFYNLTSLKTVTSNTNYVSIGAQAFYNDYRLSVFEPKISTLGESAFYNTSIEQAILADEITVIPKSAFQGCERLTTLNLPSSLVELGDYALSKTNLNRLDFPASFTTLGVDALKDIPGLENISVDSENTVYDSRNNSNALIETATNAIILGSGNTIVPDTVTSIADYAFYGNQKIQTIHTNIVESIGLLAFSGCISLHEFHIENAALTSSEDMLYNRFSTGDSRGEYGNIPNLIVFDDVSTTATLDMINNLNRQGISAYIVTNGTSIEISANQSYVAFEEVKDLSIVIHYSGFSSYPYSTLETIKDYTIEYQNGDSFRAGDTLFTIKGTTQYGESFEQPFNVSVSKAIPTYEIPTGLTAALGQTLSEIELPEGFEWTNSNQTINELGEIAYAARYIPSDTNNYEIVENINITLSVINTKTIIHPEIIIEDKMYDGLNTIPNDLITVSNLDSFEYSILSANSSSANVGIETATIKLKLTDEKYEDFSFDDNKQEQDFTIQFNIIPKKIAKPTKPDGYYTYNTEEITFAVLGYDEESMTISGNKGTNAGLYATTISLKNNNYTWDDNTIDDITLQYEIKKAKLSVTDNSSDKTVVLDNTPHTINMSLEYPSGTHIKYEDSNGDYVLDQIPEYTEVGEYTIRYKLYIDENYTEYFGEHVLTILSDFIVNFDKDVTAQDDTIIAKPEDTFSAITSKIHTTPSDNSFEYHDKNDNIIDSETIKTGDKIKIIVGGHEQEYSIAVLGDTDGDGAIADADYLSIKNDIMDIEKLSGVYKKAADMNSNDKIDIIDYIRVKKIIMGGNL